MYLIKINERAVVLPVSVALYFAACTLPAVLLHTGSNTYSPGLPQEWHWTGYESLKGIELLFAGLFGLLMGNFAGFANPLLWLSWLFLGFRRYRAAAIASGLALVFAMQTFQMMVQPYLFDEAGVRQGYLQAPQVGFFAWTASMVLVLAAGWRARSIGVTRVPAPSTPPR